MPNNLFQEKKQKAQKLGIRFKKIGQGLGIKFFHDIDCIEINIDLDSNNSIHQKINFQNPKLQGAIG